MKAFLFLLRSYPDVDHIAPFIWKCLEKGDSAFVIFDQPYDHERDYRICFLRSYPKFKILPLIGVAARWRAVRMANRVRWNQYTLGRLLRRLKIQACFFEWGGGVLKSRGAFRFFSDFAKDFRAQLFMAARACDVPVFALPHGLNTKLNIDTNPYVSRILEQNGGELPFEDRNEFTVYVFNTEYHRESYIRHARLNPQKCAAWGSLRFCPEWMGIVQTICPKASFPDKKHGQIRLLFFLPKWHNRVNKAATTSLLDSLSRRTELQLLLKTHPRKGDAEVDRGMDQVLSRENVHVLGNASSPALIEGADVVIDIGSSIAIEAILRRRPVIYPYYLHENRLIFDEYGGCLAAASEPEVHKRIDCVLEKGQALVSDEDSATVAKYTVYAGREPYDVAEYYYEQVERQLVKPPSCN